MNRFWKAVVRPVVEAIEPRVVVEVGVEQGAHTKALLEHLAGAEAVVHAIDPLPRFDAEEWSQRYGERLALHREKSLNALPRIGHVDLALIDGDHNWYTAYHELKLIAQRAASDGRPFPVVMLHDVDWPYGRRDLYYDPEAIPPDYRQPYDRLGMRPGSRHLVKRGGLNPHLYHSIYEHALRNGVRTAVEDFLEEESTAIQQVDIPGLNGLAILVSRDVATAYGALAELLTRFRSPEFLAERCEELEQARLMLQISAGESAEGLAAAKERERTMADDLNGYRQQLHARSEELRGSTEREGAAKKERERLEKERAQLLNGVRELECLGRLTAASRSWRIGHGIVGAAARMTFQRSGRGAPDLLVERAAALRSGAPAHEPILPRNDASPVTVVIAIHNAFDELARCIDSVLEHTPEPHRVLLIDDASTDERVAPLLSQYAERSSRLTALRNLVNAGYTATVNLGCRLAGGDVLLLNSDTEVAAGWLEGLREVAYAADDVATVTPVSNAAGAFSVPERSIDHDLPSDMTVADMAALVARVSPHLRPRVPTGSGFCMYIRRAALDRIGLFDEQSFPRGFGEENDLCQRALAAGLVNVVDDATFVYHKRAASFGADKPAILAEARVRVDEKHPTYKAQLRRFEADDPLRELRAAVSEALGAAARPRA